MKMRKVYDNYNTNDDERQTDKIWLEKLSWVFDSGELNIGIKKDVCIQQC